MPTPDTSRRLRARLDAGRERARAALEVHGLSLPSDEELLLSIPAGIFQGMERTQIQIYILHRGRQRAYQQFAAGKAVKDPAAGVVQPTCETGVNHACSNPDVN